MVEERRLAGAEEARQDRHRQRARTVSLAHGLMHRVVRVWARNIDGTFGKPRQLRGLPMDM